MAAALATPDSLSGLRVSRGGHQLIRNGARYGRCHINSDSCDVWIMPVIEDVQHQLDTSSE